MAGLLDIQAPENLSFSQMDPQLAKTTAVGRRALQDAYMRTVPSVLGGLASRGVLDSAVARTGLADLGNQYLSALSNLELGAAKTNVEQKGATQRALIRADTDQKIAAINVDLQRELAKIDAATKMGIVDKQTAAALAQTALQTATQRAIAEIQAAAVNKSAAARVEAVKAGQPSDLEQWAGALPGLVKAGQGLLDIGKDVWDIINAW